ncbi:hypothetical protein Tco_1385870 [Tanacetum coccineum]
MDQPKSSHAKKTDASDSASSCSETFNPFENYMSITERKLIFKGISSSTPSGSATIPTVTQPEVNETVGGEFTETRVEIIGSLSRLQLTDTILEILIPQPESPQATPKPDRGKGIARDTDESPPKLVKASTKVRPYPDTLLLVPYEIHGKMYQLTEKEIQARLDKEEKLEKAAREAMLSKPKLIKVVHEEATKAGVDPKVLSSKKGGEEFLKSQSAKIKVC